MKRLFTERVRLVIYLEATDLNAMTAKAREAGQTVIEWAREVLLGEVQSREPVEAGAVAKRDDSVGVRVRKDSGSKGHAVELGREDVPAVVRRTEKSGSACRHGVAKGWHCWQCGGIADAHD